MGYYSAFKGNEIIIHAAIWMNLDHVVLIEISQTLKDKYCVIPLIWGTQNSEIHRDRKQNGSF